MKDGVDCIVCGNIVADIIGRPIDALRPRKNVGHRSLEHIRLFPGGFASNVSIDLAKLGVRAGVIGRVGQDPWWDAIGRILESHGVDTRRMIVDKTEQTSATMVCVDSTGERTFYHTVGAQKKLCAADVLEQRAAIRRTGMFALGYYGLMPAMQADLPGMLRTLKETCRVNILLDTCSAVGPQLDDLSRSLPYVDFFIPSLFEAIRLTGRKNPAEHVRIFCDRGAPFVVGVKLGADGCILADGRQTVRVPALPVKTVVDTTGAGDSFLAGIITAYLHGMDLEQMGRFANAVGSCCVQAMGASTGIRSFRETMKLIR